MQINRSNLSKTTFKGYGAAPLKSVYMMSSSFSDQQHSVLAAAKELSSKVGKEFNVFVQIGNVLSHADNLPTEKFLPSLDRHRAFSQDYRTFLPDGKLLIPGGNLVAWHDAEVGYSHELAHILKMKTEKLPFILEGGNFFLGKKSSGENYLLLGEHAVVENVQESKNKKTILSSLLPPLTSEKFLKNLGKILGVEPENICVIPQAKSYNKDADDFHIDMFVRPLVYPYVLVNDPNIMLEKLDASMDKTNSLQQRWLSSVDKYWKRQIEQNDSLPVERTIEALEKSGFKPIRVPGIARHTTANYMNAIVHQKNNGKLIYITNEDLTCKYTNEIFKNFIKQNVPQIERVVFIKNHLLNHRGGIHCMCSEQPDFEKWA